MKALDAGRRALGDALRQRDARHALGLAGATLANNAIQLAFTVVVTRVLGKADYSALAALVSAFLVLLAGGQSVQAAAAREVALGRLGDPAALRATVARWTRTLAIATVLAAGLGLALADPLAGLVGVEEHPYAAAAVLPTGVLWMLLSLQRGVLQGLHAFRPVALSIVAEGGGRLLLGVGFALAAGGVTGVFLSSALCFAVLSAVLAGVIVRRLGPVPVAGDGGRRPLRGLLADGRIPVVGLGLLAVLQNVDVIIARHQLGEDAAGSYAVAAVAAKVAVWVAIGVGLQLLPAATARAAAGQDPRPVLLRALGVVGLVAAPSLVAFWLFPSLILRVAFGPDTVDAAPALGLLSTAMVLLAVTHLSVQYLLALGRAHFVWGLAVVAGAEIALLLPGGSITGFAARVLAAQGVAALALLLLALQSRARTTPAMIPAPSAGR